MLLIYEGFIRIRSYGEDDETVFLEGQDEPLSELLQDDISLKQVTARYWIVDQRLTAEQASETFLKFLSGRCVCQYTAHYSEISGYLWTDDELMIGGHDLLQEIESHAGKYLILEIEVHT